jgi:uncharacterized protein YegL
MILLTDGIQTGPGADAARAEAEAIKNAGIVLFVIGLGQDVDAAFLAQIASSGRYYFAPTAGELDAIYALISATIPCNSAPTEIPGTTGTPSAMPGTTGTPTSTQGVTGTPPAAPTTGTAPPALTPAPTPVRDQRLYLPLVTRR